MHEFHDEAFTKLEDWLARAKASGLAEHNAMTLSTADLNGRVSGRTVLLKGLQDGGLVFYTNTLSRKGDQLRANPLAALTFFWQPIYLQIEVEGTTVAVPDAEADAYWATRDRDSQIGGWASLQSQRLSSASELKARFQHHEAQYQGLEVPRPPHWSGYLLRPDRIEFWTGKPHRLHERVIYERNRDIWEKYEVYP